MISQAGSFKTLLISGGAIVLLIALMPLLFLALGPVGGALRPPRLGILALLLMVGLICAVLTKTLGVYYLVGAFVDRPGYPVARTSAWPTTASAQNLDAIGLFASFFIPFYFFHNGLEVPTAALVSASLLYGFVIAACVIPVRLGVVWLQSRFMQHSRHRGIFRVAVALHVQP